MRISSSLGLVSENLMMQFSLWCSLGEVDTANQFPLGLVSEKLIMQF